MSVDFTAFDAQVTGSDGAAGSASGSIDGGDAGNAIDSLPPFSNTDFSLEPSLNRVFPTTIGGTGGNAAGGANATTTTPAQLGGAGGKGGGALVTMAGDTFGSSASHYPGFVTITASATGGPGGAGGRGGLGMTVTVASNDTIGSDGADGGIGGSGEIANADLTGMISYATTDLQIQLLTTGGQGGQGGFGGSGGGGSLSAGNGGNGAAGGLGAPAESTFSGATAINDSAIFVIEKVTGGLGGMGGTGGGGGNVGPVGSPPTGFGSNGSGADGGRGGSASATVSGDTLTAPSVQFTLIANGGLGGAGGSGGSGGGAAGPNGAAGTDGAGSITFTNNVVTVGSGIPGDTLNSGSNLLLLNLRVGDIGPAGFFPGVLNGVAGGNLAFFGNTFVGNGTSRMVLQLGSTGTATVDTASNTISIDGSPTSNTISGFSTFMLDTNDTFVAGSGAYKVTFAADPDTLVFTPNSGSVTLSGITSTNFLLDFRGFGPSFDAAALAADTDTSTGSTIITLSPTSTITLQGYTGGITPGDLLFEAACYVEGTRIATPDGEVAIEHLKPGDAVLTASGAVRPVRWLGYRHVDPRHHPRPTAVQPVRVSAGAFDDGVPRRDLWLSPDHAIFADGMLVPIKRLINGGTITQVPVNGVTYFHVELPQHDLLLAEGLPAESYLDTGNRSNFANGGGAVALHPDFAEGTGQARRERYSCAHFAVSDAEVEPVWRRLADRARQLGSPIPPVGELTTDPAPSMIVDGKVLRPIGHTDMRYTFVLPVPGGGARLLSRSDHPTLKTPWSDDGRRLGLRVTKLSIRGGEVFREIPADHPCLITGWHDAERDDHHIWRWTDGDALVPDELFTDILGPVIVELHFVGGMHYAAEKPRAPAIAANRNRRDVHDPEIATRKASRA